MELLEAAVVVHGHVAVGLPEVDGRVPGDAVVGDPDDQIDQSLAPASLQLLAAPDAPTISEGFGPVPLSLDSTSANAPGAPPGGWGPPA